MCGEFLRRQEGQSFLIRENLKSFQKGRLRYRRKKNGQRIWLAGIQANPDVDYWLILVDGQPAGVINLTGLENPEGNLGWAYYVGEKRLRSLGTALSLEMSMYDYAFVVLKKQAVYSDVFTLNKGVIQLHKFCGCEVVEEKKSHICKEGIWYDVTFMRMTAENWFEFRHGKKYEKIEFAGRKEDEQGN